VGGGVREPSVRLRRSSTVFVMPTYFVQAALHTSTSIPEDNIVNTWTFSGDGTGTTVGDGEAIVDALSAFYIALTDESLLSEHFFGGIEFFIYEPVLQAPFTLGSPVFYFFNQTLGGSGNGFPAEVAICLSWAAGPAVGVPANRRRGRIYVGPIALTAGTGDPAVRVTQAAQDFILDAYVELANTVGPLGLPPVIWSRTEGTVFFVERSWCDNAFDTVRSRGERASARSTRP
jgi:hypothetical protein